MNVLQGTLVSPCKPFTCYMAAGSMLEQYIGDEG